MRILTTFPDLACKTLHLSCDSCKSQISSSFVGGQPPPTRLLATGQYAATPSAGFYPAPNSPQTDNPFEGFILDEQEDSLIPQIIYIKGNFGGWNNIIFEKYTNSSQLDRLKHCHASNPILALALDGKGFHGQHNRSWQTGPGNLYISTYSPFSITLSNSTQVYHRLHQIPCAAVIKALKQVIHFTPSCILNIKPPNDIVVTIQKQTYKLGGCLTDITLQGNQITSLRMGIGLNIHFAPDIPPTEGLPAACCSGFHQDPTDDLFFPLLKSIATNLYDAVSSDSEGSSVF